LSVNGLSVNGLSAVTTAAAAPACIGKPSKAAWASAAVELGDAVYSQHIPKPPTPTEPAAEPPAAEASPAEDVKNPQKTSN
jgi:hypothetical protein